MHVTGIKLCLQKKIHGDQGFKDDVILVTFLACLLWHHEPLREKIFLLSWKEDGEYDNI